METTTRSLPTAVSFGRRKDSVIVSRPDWDKVPADMALMCIIKEDNNSFPITVWLHSPAALLAFNKPGDTRCKIWLHVNKKAIEAAVGHRAWTIVNF